MPSDPPLAKSRRFLVGLSYPSNHGTFVKTIATQLAEVFGRERVFLDTWYEVELVGGNGAKKFRDLFRDECEIVVPFFSKHYEKKWCCEEWHTIQAVLFERRRDDTVIPIAMDSTRVDGWEEIDIAIKRGKHNAQQVAPRLVKAIQAKIKKQTETTGETESEPTAIEPKTKANAKARESSWQQGTIVVAERVGSSELRGNEWADVMHSLLEIPISLGLISKGKETNANSLLSGVVIAIQGIRHLDLLDKCSTWIDRMKMDHGVDLRIACDIGSYYRLRRDNNAGATIVGITPTACHQMLRIAGAGEIVVSQRFVNEWTQDARTIESVNLQPPLGSPAREIQFGSSTSTQFRFFRTAHPSSLLVQADAADQALIELMENLEEDFIRYLSEETPSLTSKKVGARVSLFVPATCGTKLVSTKFRFLRNAKEGETLSKPGITSYSIVEPRVQGTVGNAFVSCAPQMLLGLSDYKKSPTRYRDSLAISPWHIPIESIPTFSRWARSFLAFPIMLPTIKSLERSGHPSRFADGAICIDAANSLTSVPRQHVEDVLNYLMMEYSTTLAVWWRLRGINS